LAHEQIDERALVSLQGIVRTSVIRSRGSFYQTFEGFAPASEWETIPRAPESQDSREVQADDL